MSEYVEAQLNEVDSDIQKQEQVLERLEKELEAAKSRYQQLRDKESRLIWAIKYGIQYAVLSLNGLDEAC